MAEFQRSLVELVAEKDAALRATTDTAAGT
jgi:hypothetical protein